MPQGCQDSSETRTLHMVYSFACNLSCGHCIFRCGPDNHEEMGIRRAKAFIEEARAAGIRRIVFTGGEPLLYPQELRDLIRHTAAQGMTSALITNAAWASSGTQATTYLADLKECGLESITVSTDRYHLQEVPLENILNVLDTSGDIGLRAAVKIARLRDDAVAEGLSRSLRNCGARVLLQDISPMGRATALRSAVEHRPAMTCVGPGCRTPAVLLPGGDLLTCCNLPAQDVRASDYPFVLGNVEREPLDSLLEKRSRDPVLAALRSKGPGALLALLSKEHPALEDTGHLRCHSACDLCFHLFCGLRNKRLLYTALGRQAKTERESPGASL